MTREWAPYQTVRELIHRHKDQPAVVIGGGPSAPAGLAQCPSDAIGISANDHGFKLRACDFITSLDRIERRLRVHGVPIVSRHLFADYRVLVVPQPNSGIVGAWLARLMGCTPIYLVGMDCWDGGTYFHDATAKSSGFSEPPRNHLARWREFLRKFPAAYTAFAGAISKQCPALDEKPPSRDRLLREVAGEVVRFHRDSVLKTFGIERPFRTGDVIEVEADEARRLIRERKAAKVASERRAG